MYPVYEKSGIRTVQIPSSHKPGALGDDVMRNIRAIMQRANSFLDTHDVNATGTSAAADGMAVDHDASADVEGSADVEAMKRELQELRSISQASQVAREIFEYFNAFLFVFSLFVFVFSLFVFVFLTLVSSRLRVKWSAR
jgi:hypothetical protein